MTIQVSYREKPSDGQWTHREFESEQTIAQLFEQCIPKTYWNLVDCKNLVPDLPENHPNVWDKQAMDYYERTKKEMEGVCCYGVTVNGEKVEPDQWEYSWIEHGDEVSIAAQPAGVFSSIKKLLIIAIIVFVVVYVAINFGWAATLPAPAEGTAAASLYETLGAQAFTAFAAAAVSFMTGFLMTFLQPSIGSSGSEGSPTYRLAGTGNRARHWAPVPKIFGQMRFHPVICATTYPETVGDKQLLRFLMTYGLGDVITTNVKLGQTPITRFKGVSTNTIRNGTTENLEYYSKRRRQDNYQIRLGPEATELTTEADTKEAVINIHFPAGMFFQDQLHVREEAVKIKWEWKTHSDTDYAPEGSLAGSGAVYLGEGDVQHVVVENFSGVGGGSFGRELEASLEAHKESYRLTGASYLPNTLDYFTVNEDSDDYEGQSGTAAPKIKQIVWARVSTSIRRGRSDIENRMGLEMESSWTGWLNKSLYVMVNGDLFFEHEFTDFTVTDSNRKFAWDRTYSSRLPVKGDDDVKVAIADQNLSKADVFGTDAGTPAATGDYRKKQKSAFGKGEKEIKEGRRNAFDKRIDIVFPARGTYDIKIWRDPDEKEDVRSETRAFLTFIQSVTPDNPVATTENMTYIEGKVQASEQLSGQLNSINAECSAVIPVWNGRAWVDEETSNPAWICCYILKEGPFGLTDEFLDLGAWTEFAAFCTARGYEWNGVLEQEVTKEDALKIILDVAHAEVARTNGKYGVLWNDPNAQPVQLFSVRNIGALRQSIEYVDELHGMRVSYADDARGGIVQEVPVYSTGHDETNSYKFETRENVGIRQREQATKYGRFKLAERELRPGMYMFSSYYDHLVCTRGDRVLLQGFHLATRYCSARISKIETAADNTTIRYIWGDIPPSPEIPQSETTELQMRISSAGAVRAVRCYWHQAAGRFEVKTGDTLVYDENNAESVKIGDHVIVGEPGSDVVDLRVKDIQYSGVGVANLSCTDWNVTELLSAENTGVIPAYSPYLSDGTEYIEGEISAFHLPPEPEFVSVHGDSSAGEGTEEDYVPGIRALFKYNYAAVGMRLVVAIRALVGGHTAEQSQPATQLEVKFPNCRAGVTYRVFAWHENDQGQRSNTVSRTVLVTGYLYTIPLPSLFQVREVESLREYQWQFSADTQHLVKEIALEYQKQGHSPSDEWFPIRVEYEVVDGVKEISGGVPVRATPYTSPLPEEGGAHHIRVTPIDHVGRPGNSIIHDVVFESGVVQVGSLFDIRLTVREIPTDYTTDPDTWGLESSGIYFQDNMGDNRVLVATLHYTWGEAVPSGDNFDYADAFTFQWLKNGGNFTPQISIGGGSQPTNKRYLVLGPDDVADNGQDTFTVRVSRLRAIYGDIHYGWEYENNRSYSIVDGEVQFTETVNGQAMVGRLRNTPYISSNWLELPDYPGVDEAYLMILVDTRAGELQQVRIGEIEYSVSNQSVNEIAGSLTIGSNTYRKYYVNGRALGTPDTSGQLRLRVGEFSTQRILLVR